jgi:hypothetical protein
MKNSGNFTVKNGAFAKQKWSLMDFHQRNKYIYNYIYKYTYYIHMSSQCTVCQLFALYLKVCEEIKQQIWVAGLAQLRIVEVFRSPPPSEGHPAI